MGLRSFSAALAADGPAPVFPIIGAGARDFGQALRLDDRLRIVDTPRAANILLILGEITADLLRPAVHVHDAMSHPRATLWAPLGAPVSRLSGLFPATCIVDSGDELVPDIVRTHRDLLLNDRASEGDVLPDEDPAEWRDVGPYGQGGKGMTGGVPYGRPMAERAPDRDGLQLDKLDVRVGPFFSAIPPGLTLDVRLQGDLIQEASLRPNPFRRRRSPSPDDIFRSALRAPTSIEALEVARARHHLRWLSDMLRVHGLGALAFRTLVLARDLTPSSAATVRSLGKLIDRARSLSWATAGVGLLPEDVAVAARGPVARAAGTGDDARADDRAYGDLGFVPVSHPGGDARARWRQRLAEAVQALEIAKRAGPRQTEPNGRVESPRGEISSAPSQGDPLLDALPALLAGQEWGDAVTTIVSLDLDLDLDLDRDRNLDLDLGADR